MSYRNNILPFNNNLSTDQSNPPSLSDPMIWQKYHGEYVGLSEDLKPFVNVLPGLGDIVYSTIPCHIISWLYASGDPVHRFNSLEESRQMLDIQLEEFLRRDVPVYLSDFIDFFDIKWAKGGNLFANVRQGNLYDCVERTMSLLAQIKSSTRMKSLIEGALVHAKPEQLKAMVYAGEFELRDEEGQLRQRKSSLKNDEKEDFQIYDEGVTDENEGKTNFKETPRCRGVHSKSNLDEVSLSESQNEFIASMMTSEEEQSAVLEDVQRLAASIEVPEILILRPTLGTDGGSDIGISVSDHFGDSRFTESIKIDESLNKSDDPMSTNSDREAGDTSAEAMLNLLEEFTEPEISPAASPMDIDPVEEVVALDTERMSPKELTPMEIDSIQQEPVMCPEYKTAHQLIGQPEEVGEAQSRCDGLHQKPKIHKDEDGNEKQGSEKRRKIRELVEKAKRWASLSRKSGDKKFASEKGKQKEEEEALVTTTAPTKKRKSEDKNDDSDTDHEDEKLKEEDQ
ncbi:hypothetical protein AA313_de0201773 [Arthrobotrys entomopaga]|nr:hypothetical protein AA313_de0201773 [Arthrobotrys entomopaga]